MSDHIMNTIVTDITHQVSQHPEYSGHEGVFLVTDEASGLEARIFIHSLVQGRALGGCRRWNYAGEQDWNADGLRLSRGMARKSAVAGLPLGGAKAAICHNGTPTAAMMRAFGRGIDIIEKTYGMTYITAEDVGITEDLLREVKTQTANVRGVTAGDGLSGGDPGPFTAYGVFTGIKTAVRHKLGRDDLGGVRVAVQGLGDVGYYLCKFLREAGADLFVADLDAARVSRVVNEFGATSVVPAEIAALDADVFAPCAMGGVLDGTAVGARIVAGSTNNQQKNEIGNIESKILKDDGVLYAPDYVINAGGLISVFYEGEDGDKIMDMIGKQVETTLDRIFTVSQRECVDTATVADKLAEKMRGGQGMQDVSSRRAVA